MEIRRLILLFVLASLSLPAAVLADSKNDTIKALAVYAGPDREQILLEGAKREGQLNLYSTLTVPDLQRLSAAFEDKYGVKVNYWRAGSEKVVQRALTEARSGHHEVDVIETNGPELEALQREGLFQKAISPHLANLVPQARRPHDEWVGTRLNLFVQGYNTNLVNKEDLPNTYQGLLDPKWKGKLGVEEGDYDWFATVAQELGEDEAQSLFREIVKQNGMSVRKGHSLLAGLTSAGEVPMALTVYSHNIDKLKDKGAPVDWFGIKPIVGRANGIAVAKNTPNPHAAVLFYDFMLSDGQNILRDGNYYTVSKSDTRASGMDIRFVDPVLILDQNAKWQDLYKAIFTEK
jgi:iron(III) transport system substrate-binding protein